MAVNIYPAVSLIGGGDGALDKIDGDGLVNGDGAIVITSTGSYIYRLNSTSGEAESSPDIISPDANAGDKRWILTSVEDSIGFSITAAGKALLDDADAAAQRETLGVSVVGIPVAYESGQKPSAAAEVSIIPVFPLTFPSSLAGAVYDATGSTAPTAEAVVSLEKNGVEFGTLTVSTGNVATFASPAGASFNGSTDRLTAVFPTAQDSTWSGPSFTLKGVRG